MYSNLVDEDDETSISILKCLLIPFNIKRYALDERTTNFAYKL